MLGMKNWKPRILNTFCVCTHTNLRLLPSLSSTIICPPGVGVGVGVTVGAGIVGVGVCVAVGVGMFVGAMVEVGVLVGA